MSKQGGFSSVILLLGVLLILIAGGGYYLYSQQPSSPPTNIFPASLTPIPTVIHEADPTADWKVYLDSENNFSFRYPQSWIITTSTKKIVKFDIPLCGPSELCSSPPPGEVLSSLSMEVLPNPNNTLVAEFAKPDWMNYVGSDPDMLAQSLISNQERQAILKDRVKVEDSFGFSAPTQCGENNFFYIKNKQSIIKFKFECVDKFSSILSTFKFIQSSPSVTKLSPPVHVNPTTIPTYIPTTPYMAP